MIELNTVLSTIITELQPTTDKLDFKIVIPDNIEKGELPIFQRGSGAYIAYEGSKGKLRILFSDNKIRLLSGEKEAKSEDDSDYTLLASYLMILDEYDLKDAKSVTNEIAENLTEAYSPKKIAKRQQTVKAQATVSRSAVKNGALLYDPATLAIRLAALYPEIKDEYKNHLEKYDEFLCENFFTTVVNPLVFATIRTNNPQQMKKLFNILNEIYEDGSNEVQDVIIVTMLSSYDYQGDMLQNVLKYVSDTIVEPFIAVNKKVKTSKTVQMRLANPPKYKPKKQKKKAMSSILNQ